MNVVFLILSACALFFLCITLWNVLCWKKVRGDGKMPAAALVSVLIPARNEEKNLAGCLETVIRQGEIVGEILVYNDHSTDSTAQIISRYAGHDGRIRAIETLELPEGWGGKNFACARLASEAEGEWLLFLDADARLGEKALAKILGEAKRRGITFLSCWGKLELESFWERALMPMLNFVVFSVYPAPLALRLRAVSLGLAHGACLLVERAAYVRLGGHEMVRSEIFEDVSLARLWREHHELSLCLDGQTVVSLRMYSSLGEIWRGFQKNFYPSFRRDASFWAFVGLHLVIFLLPFVLLPFFAAGENAAALIFIVFCVLLMRAALAFRFRHPWWSVLFHPAAEFILLAIGISSWWRCKTGRGVSWKGRRYYGEKKGIKISDTP